MTHRDMPREHRLPPRRRKPPPAPHRRTYGPGTPSSIAAGATLAAAVGVACLDGGGFSAPSQSIFIALSGVALLAAANFDGHAVLTAVRSPLALTLAALAGLSIASAAWTVDEPTGALRSGLVIGGYAAVFAAAATLARRPGPWPFAIAITITILALVEAIIGLDAVAMHTLPDAERIAGAWRPGGTFEYPPALAIVQVGALPVLCGLLGRRPRLLAVGAGAAATLAGAVLALSQSRLAAAMAAVLLAMLVLRPHAHRPARMAAVATIAFVVVGALPAPTILGAHAAPVAPGSDVAAASTASRGLTARPEHAVTRNSDWLHGRSREWDAALQTWLDRPLLGAGAGAYYTASIPHQGAAQSRYAHNLPLELAAELGVLGLLLGIILYASTVWSVSRALHTPALWLLAPFAVAFLPSNLLDWTWHLAGLGALWAAAAGGLNGAAQATSPTDKVTHPSG